MNPGTSLTKYQSDAFKCKTTCFAIASPKGYHSNDDISAGSTSRQPVALPCRVSNEIIKTQLYQPGLPVVPRQYLPPLEVHVCCCGQPLLPTEKTLV